MQKHLYERRDGTKQRTMMRWKKKEAGEWEEEEEDIKPYLRLARPRVGERWQLRSEESMSEAAAALMSGVLSSIFLLFVADRGASHEF